MQKDEVHDRRVSCVHKVRHYIINEAQFNWKKFRSSQNSKGCSIILLHSVRKLGDMERISVKKCKKENL